MMTTTMSVETVRYISDPFEWRTLSRDAPSPYHDWEWSEQSRRRVRAKLPRTYDVDAAYLRIWIGDAMITCPLLLIDDTWYNIPRAVPCVVGGEIDPIETIAALDADIEICDDSAQLGRVEIDRLVCLGQCEYVIRRKSFGELDLDALASALRWDSELDRREWLEAIAWLWRSGFDCRYVEYIDSEAHPIGWSFEIVKHHRLHTVAAAHIYGPVQPWTSPR